MTLQELSDELQMRLGWQSAHHIKERGVLGKDRQDGSW
jgi:hypothetical protein